MDLYKHSIVDLEEQKLYKNFLQLAADMCYLKQTNKKVMRWKFIKPSSKRIKHQQHSVNKKIKMKWENMDNKICFLVKWFIIVGFDI